MGRTGVPPVLAGVPPAKPEARGFHDMANAIRRVGDSAGRRAEQAGRLCYPSRCALNCIASAIPLEMRATPCY